MFDPETIDLIRRAPPLEGLDLENLPRLLTDAFATVVAARIRLRTGAPEASQAERIVKARVRTAIALEPAQIETLKAALKRRFGRDVELSNEIDPGVLGGAVIDAGDVVIDGSVRGRLTKMQNALTH